MEAHRVRCVINVPNGPSRRVGANGLLIGRKHDCDIVSPDPSVSRRHALVRLTSDGAEIMPLGRAPIEVNGKKHDRPIALADGDEVGLPGLVLNVRIAAQRPNKTTQASWRLERARGGSFGIVQSPFVMGGGETDDLIVKRWPEHALQFYLAQGELYVEPCVGKVAHNGVEIAAGELALLGDGDVIGFRKETLAVRRVGHDATTAISSLADLPSRVTIEMLPRGGRIVFATAEGERAVFLADRRFDLMVALLEPPEGYCTGSFVPDDALAAVVWPRKPGISRMEINVLIRRCRRDLIEAGLAGSRLIERAPGGGATRVALATDAIVQIET